MQRYIVYPVRSLIGVKEKAHTISAKNLESLRKRLIVEFPLTDLQVWKDGDIAPALRPPIGLLKLIGSGPYWLPVNSKNEYPVNPRDGTLGKSSKATLPFIYHGKR